MMNEMSPENAAKAFQNFVGLSLDTVNLTDDEKNLLAKVAGKKLETLRTTLENDRKQKAQIIADASDEPEQAKAQLASLRQTANYIAEDEQKITSLVQALTVLGFDIPEMKTAMTAVQANMDQMASATIQ